MVNKKPRQEEEVADQAGAECNSATQDKENTRMADKDCANLSDHEGVKKRQKLSRSSESLTVHTLHRNHDWRSNSTCEQLRLTGRCSCEHNALPRDNYNQSPLHVAVHLNQLATLEHLLASDVHIDALDLNGRTALHVSVIYGNVLFTNLLLKHGANLRIKTHDGFDALYFAVQSGVTKLVELCVENGCNVNEPIIDGDLNKQCTYLHCAVERNFITMVETLLNAGAKINQCDSYNNTALHIAVRKGFTEIAHLLLAREASVHDKDNGGRTALYYAVSICHKELFDLLVEHGADLNERYMTGGESLLHLAVNKRSADFVSILLKKGANVNAANNFGKTPLHLAITNKDWPAFKLLMQHGADVNQQESHGKTALHIAIEYNRKEIFTILVKFGADVNAQDAVDQTPLHLAVKQGCPNTVQLFLENGADVHIQDEAYQTALHFAAKVGNVHLFEMLKNHEADVNAADIDGNTPLHLSIAAECHKLVYLQLEYTFVQALLRNGACVYKRTLTTDETPLIVAVKKKSAPFTKSLLTCGAEVNAVERLSKRTPLHIAVENSDPENIHQLLIYGADIERLDDDGKSPLDYAKCPAITFVFARYFARISIAGRNVPKSSPVDDDQTFKTLCENEVKKMKRTKLYDNVTYFDFLKGTRRSLVRFVQNENVVNVFEQQLQRTAFPLYSDMLERNFVVGKRYVNLIDAATQSLNAVSEFKLTEIPVERILNYLDVRDMKNLIKATDE